MQLKGYKARKGQSNPLQVWGLRLLVAGCVVAFGWLWWQEGPEPSGNSGQGKKGSADGKSARRGPLPKIDIHKLPRVVLTNAKPAPPQPISAQTLRSTNLPPVGFIASNSATSGQFPSGTNVIPVGFPRPPMNAFEVQIALARLGINAGPIDGVMGSQTRAALRAFQAREKLPTTGVLDPATSSRLVLADDPKTTYIITEEDRKRLRPLSSTWFGKSQQDRLDYETLLELVSEKFWSHPQMIRKLNPGLDWSKVGSGSVVFVPRVDPTQVSGPAAFVLISLEGRHLQAFDQSTNLLAHFPCSIAQLAEKRPVGKLTVEALIPSPNYRFDPANFPTAPEAALGRLMIPPGPNNPVGTVWIALSRPGYGIHGTPRPEEVGRTGSLGCFRLANWNAERLLKMAWTGMPVYVNP